MKKRGMYILLSGMMIFSSALYGGIREVKAAGDGEIQISAEILKVEVNGQEKEIEQRSVRTGCSSKKRISQYRYDHCKNTQRGCGRRPDERIWRDRGTDVASE